MSDRIPDDQLPTLDTRMDDLRAVMDAVGQDTRRCSLFSAGGNMCMLFAASHPERTLALVTYSCFAKRIWSPDYPWAPTPEARAKEYEQVGANGVTRWTSRTTSPARFATVTSFNASPPISATPQAPALQ